MEYTITKGHSLSTQVQGPAPFLNTKEETKKMRAALGSSGTKGGLQSAVSCPRNETEDSGN